MTSPTEAPRTDGRWCVICPPRHHWIEAAAPASPDVARDRLLSSRELPPLPWSSRADCEPWPNEAANHHLILDANGKPIFGRNWKEVCAAIEYLVRSANRAALPAAAPAPLDEAFLEFGQWLADNPAMLSGIVEAIELGEPDEYRATVDAFLTAYAATPPTDEDND